mmetsp:Transcript_27524/g.43561  ORF Transcript_27524/g.43561 Transcript_27524/m.43561 type:complete len:120 (-) Transcript_27524:380-739(-)
MHKDSRFASFYGKIPEWKHEKIRKLRKLRANEAALNNCSLITLALAWTLKNENMTVVILGARKVDQLDVQFKAIELAQKLDENVMKKIEETLQNKPVPDPKLFSSWGRSKRNFRAKSKL